MPHTTRVRLQEQAFLKRVRELPGGESIDYIGQEFFDVAIAYVSGLNIPTAVLDDAHYQTLHDPLFRLPVNRVFLDRSLRDSHILRRRSELGDGAPHKLDSLQGAQNMWPHCVALLDDGVFSGRTITEVRRYLLSIGVAVRVTFVVVGKKETVDRLRGVSSDEQSLHLLGSLFAAGWDHSRDLMGVHGLKIGEHGFVPYWSIPEWISLKGIDKQKLVRLCRETFAVFERFIGDGYGLIFERYGDHLVPRIDTTQ